MIKVFVYSYKGKSLVDSAISLIDNASTPIFVNIKDQNPLTREPKFKEYKSVHYQNVFWDHQYGPASYRGEQIDQTQTDYLLLMTDDIFLNPGWDTELIDFVNKNSDVIVSGSGYSEYVQKDKYSLKIQSQESEMFNLSHIIDNNFIFGKTSTLKLLNYPIGLKYFGESEILSIEAFCSGIDVFSAPSYIYSDKLVRTLENLYSPFSIEHNYNSFIDIINGDDQIANQHLSNTKRKLSEFLEYHGILRYNLKRIPYQNNDVLYDPNKMKIMDVGGERFIGKVKAIY